MSKITLRGGNYPIMKEGHGKIPCLCIGIGSLMLRTMSEKFKSLFLVYSSDLYWISKDKLADPIRLTLDEIVDDIIDIIHQLKLKKPVLLAHSCYGIVALEVAKRQNHPIGGLILVASPPCWSPESIAFAKSYFDANALNERKENDKQRQATYAKIKKPTDSCLNLNVYEADSARYWADFHVTREKLDALWKDIEVDDELALHFYDTLLPAHDIANGMEKVDVPVFLAAGRQDYDSVPLELWKKYPKPKDFTLLDCGDKAGHWPNIECQELFDQEVEKWIC